MTEKDVCIIVPVFNDWDCLSRLVGEIGALGIAQQFPGCKLRLVAVDDHSSRKMTDSERQTIASGPVPTSILRLKRNLGHQKAIVLGLAHTHQRAAADVYVVMDVDGEDEPKDIPRLLKAFFESPDHDVIFAERTRRSESLTFKVFYHFYRALHRFLTGVQVRVGNFSVISADAADALGVTTESWLHYAAAIFRSRLRYKGIPAARGRRWFGKSHMNFVTLTAHGVSALAVFGELIGIRLMTALVLYYAAFVAAVFLVPALGFTGAAPQMLVPLMLFSLPMVGVAVVLTLFLMFSSRSQLNVVPARDYTLFVKDPALELR